MKSLHFLKGLPASGKTSWATTLVLDAQPNSIKRVNKDLLRKMLDVGRHSRGSEKFVLSVRDFVIAQALREGKHVIVDDTNLAPFHEERIREIAEKYTKETGNPINFIVKFFDISLEEAIERDAKRSESVGEEVIRNMYNKYIAPNLIPERPHQAEQNPDLPRAIICDLDGTLAHLNRSPFDVSKVDKDDLNKPVAEIVRTYNNLGHKILLVSGREGTVEGIAKTKQWLKDHSIPYFMLLMRSAGDNQRDADLKRGFYERHILDTFHVDFVLDDRQQVVDMWRGAGLTCLQVAPGDF